MLEILHEPLGIEDPYTSRPTERLPRAPVAHERVSLGLLTRPAGLAEQVTVELEATGRAPQTVPAARESQVDGADRWIADIGGFAAGDEVSYRARARSGATEQASTPTYSFTVAQWHVPTRIDSWAARRGALLLSLASPDSREPATLALWFRGHDQLCMRFWPCGGAPQFDVGSAEPLSAHEDNGVLVARSGHATIELQLATGALLVYLEGHVVMRFAPESAFVTWLGMGPLPLAVRLHFALQDDEALYGSGERYDQLDRRGTRFDMRVYEQYKDQGARTYLPVPVLLSSRGHAIAVDGTRTMRLDAGATDARTLVIEADVARECHASLSARVFLTQTPTAGLQAYLRETGLPALPPDWAFGLWMSANDWNSQSRVLAEVARGKTADIPGDVVVIEAWADEATFYIWNDAQYAPLPADRSPRLGDFHFPADGRWPDPKAMVDTLHGQGIRLVLWQIPLHKQMETQHPQNEADSATLIQQGWCAHRPDGSPYRNPGWWFPGALLPDFTNPEATEWWLSRRRYLVEELGVDGFKTDGGEHIWGSDVVFADGRHGDELINAFPVLYAAAYHRLLAECGRTDGLTFSRSGFAGSQRYPAHWAGDENSTWPAFRHSILAGLSAAASGIPFWGWDIAGFSQEIPTGELYCRAWMMATFCPIMQYHSEYNGNATPSRDRTPWNIAERTGDPHVLPVCRAYTRIRRQLRPYIVREATHTASTGLPLMCAMPLAFPADITCRGFPYQYLFGRDLLVAPTVEPGATVQQVYLPAGRWRDLWTGETRYGPATVERQVPADVIPVYVRDGAQSPLASS